MLCTCHDNNEGEDLQGDEEDDETKKNGTRIVNETMVRNNDGDEISSRKRMKTGNETMAKIGQSWSRAQE